MHRKTARPKIKKSGPVFQARSFGFGALEIELHAQLHNAGIASGDDLPECWRGHRGLHCIEISVIERVECLKPELSIQALRHFYVFEQ
jgi:hypothetical protein